MELRLEERKLALEAGRILELVKDDQLRGEVWVTELLLWAKGFAFEHRTTVLIGLAAAVTAATYHKAGGSTQYLLCLPEVGNIHRLISAINGEVISPSLFLPNHGAGVDILQALGIEKPDWLALNNTASGDGR